MAVTDEPSPSARRATVLPWPVPRRLASVGGRECDFDGRQRNGAERLEAVREYALAVFGNSTAAAAWLGQTHAAILGATAVVSEACQCLDGFRQSMLELLRLQSRRDAPPPD